MRRAVQYWDSFFGQKRLDRLGGVLWIFVLEQDPASTSQFFPSRNESVFENLLVQDLIHVLGADADV